MLRKGACRGQLRPLHLDVGGEHTLSPDSSSGEKKAAVLVFWAAGSGAVGDICLSAGESVLAEEPAQALEIRADEQSSLVIAEIFM